MDFENYCVNATYADKYVSIDNKYDSLVYTYDLEQQVFEMEGCIPEYDDYKGGRDEIHVTLQALTAY